MLVQVVAEAGIPGTTLSFNSLQAQGPPGTLLIPYGSTQLPPPAACQFCFLTVMSTCSGRCLTITDMYLPTLSPYLTLQIPRIENPLVVFLVVDAHSLVEA